MKKSKVLIYTVLLIILDVFLNNIKIFTDISFVSLGLSVALIACITLGIWSAVATGIMGYLITAALKDWPTGFENHISMIFIIAASLIIFKLIYNKNKIFGFIMFCILNSMSTVLPFYLTLGTYFSLSMVAPFIAIALINGIVAYFGAVLIKKSYSPSRRKTAR